MVTTFNATLMFFSDCKEVSISSSVLGTTGWTTFLRLTMAGSMSRNVTSSMLPRSQTSSSYRTRTGSRVVSALRFGLDFTSRFFTCWGSGSWRRWINSPLFICAVPRHPCFLLSTQRIYTIDPTALSLEYIKFLSTTKTSVPLHPHSITR